MFGFQTIGLVFFHNYFIIEFLSSKNSIPRIVPQTNLYNLNYMSITVNRIFVFLRDVCNIYIIHNFNCTNYITERQNIHIIL